MSRKKTTTYKKGLDLEKRVASWLRRTWGFKCKLRDLVRGKAVKRPYEVDVHAIKEDLFGATDVWVECKAYKIKRRHVTKLVASAEDVKDAEDEGISEWYPDILMLVSSKGFDIDAIGWANKKDIYCVKANPKSFEFVSEMTREDFDSLESSDY